MAPFEALYGRKCRTPLNWSETGESQIFVIFALYRNQGCYISRRGEVSYRLELPVELSSFHDVFHVSLLRKCLQVPLEKTAYSSIDFRTIDMYQDLTYREQPLHILGTSLHVTRKHAIKFFKVQWSNHSEEEATWEHKYYLKKEFPDFSLA